MTKFEEEVKRPDNGPLTELNNNMQEVFSQYRKMRQYADYLEYELKQKNEHILKVENENSFMRDERTTFDSNGMAVEPNLQQQALPVVPECVAEWIEHCKGMGYGLIAALTFKLSSTMHEELSAKILKWLGNEGNDETFALAFITGKYEVEKPQLFYLKNKLTRKYLRKSKHTKDDWNEDFDRVETVNNKTKFTQQEIDSMETGSYEQIKVEEEK